MKIAIVGTGALGSYYGAKLCRDGHATHFLLRSDYEQVRRQGIEVCGDTEAFRVRPRCARTADEIGPCDLVLIGLKTTANAEFPRLLPALVGPTTAILTLQNGLGNEEALAKLFPVEQILGGLCFVSLNRIAPGVVRHIDGGRILFGEFQRWPEPRTHDLATLFRHAGIPCQVADNLARAHWLKLVWNIPFNGLGVAGVVGYEALTDSKFEIRNSQFPAPVLATDALLSDTRWAALVRELMQEVIAAANALGHNIEPGYAEAEIERTQTMGRYLASTLIDFERGSVLEVESLILEPLRQARAAGVPVPRLEAVCRVLTGLAERRGPS